MNTSDKIAVVTWSNRLAQFEPVERVISAYCRRHGYERIVSTERHVPDWNPSWERIPLLLELLPRYRAALYLDDDAVIYQFNRTVESYLDAFPSKSFFLSRVERGNGYKGSPIMGVFIMRNDPYTLGLLQRSRSRSAVCPAPRVNNSRCCWEQDCVWRMFKRDQPNVYHLDSGSAVQFLLGTEFNCIEQLGNSHRSHHAVRLRCRKPFAFHEMGQPKTGYIQQKARLVQRLWEAGEGALGTSASHGLRKRVRAPAG